MPALQSTRGEYKGVLDENYLRQGFGTEIFYRKPGTEIYEGNFTNSIYHGDGQYTSKNLQSPWTFEGKFYANKKESYGSMSYPDGSVFQGLYRNDHQFGPGIFINSSGQQDVGLWWGSKIIRLIQSIDGIQQLGTTPFYKAKLLTFKKLVSVSKLYDKDVAKDVMLKLKVSRCLSKYSDLLYSCHAKTPDNLMFDKKIFNNNFVRIEKEILINLKTNPVDDCRIKPFCAKIKKVLQNESPSDTVLNENIQLLAWNNSLISIFLLQHCFQNSHLEDSVNFDVSSILVGKRENFPEEGQHENDCMNFLLACADGNYQTVFTLLTLDKVNPCLSDKYGNSGVLIAAANEQAKIIKLLSDFGSDINAENDEGLSPLTYALCRYIARKKDIKSWGETFLSPEQMLPTDGPHKLWRYSLSSELIKTETQKSLKRPLSLNSGNIKVKTGHYIFDIVHEHKIKTDQDVKTNPSTVKISKQKKKKKSKGNKKKKKKVSRMSKLISEKTELQKVEEPPTIITSGSKTYKYDETFKNIEETVKILLEEGADPDLSNVPAAPILLSIVCGNIKITEALLKYCANPNTKLLQNDNGFTALHLLCLMKPKNYFPDLMNLFLKYNADPLIRAKFDYDKGTLTKLLYGVPEGVFYNDGVTPLQALCLRPDVTTIQGKDYQQMMVCTLVKVTNDSGLFFGHTPLTLAVIQCNVGLAFMIIKCTPENPNRIVHPLHGNPLTVMIKYYPMLEDPMPMLNLLALLGANPLMIVNMVENSGNIMNYAHLKKTSYISDDREHETAVKNKSSKKKKHSGKKSSKSRGKKSTGRKSGKKSAESKSGKKSAGSKSEKKSGGSKSRKKSTGSKREERKESGKGLTSEEGNDEIKKKETSKKGKSSKKKSSARSSKKKKGHTAEVTQKKMSTYLTFLTTLQNLARSKVNKYIQGKLFRELISSEKEGVDLKYSVSLDLLEEVINWLTPDDYVNILIEHLKNGMTNITINSALIFLELFFQVKLINFNLIQCIQEEELSNGKANLKKVMPDQNEKEKMILYSMEALQKKILSAYNEMNEIGRISKDSQRNEINYDLHPELDTEGILYKVCYRCGIRSPSLKRCSDCGLVKFCCPSCEFEDTYDDDSKHLCKAELRREAKKKSKKKLPKSKGKKNDKNRSSSKKSSKKTESKKKTSSKGKSSKSSGVSKKILSELRYSSKESFETVERSRRLKFHPWEFPRVNAATSSTDESESSEESVFSLIQNKSIFPNYDIPRKYSKSTEKPSKKGVVWKMAVDRNSGSKIKTKKVGHNSEENNDFHNEVIPYKCYTFLKEMFSANISPDVISPYLIVQNDKLFVKKKCVK